MYWKENSDVVHGHNSKVLTGRPASIAAIIVRIYRGIAYSLTARRQILVQNFFFNQITRLLLKFLL